ncbi:glutathione S-transferase [Boletus reticuloceps]|uniref:Glutathione S-transferase n=1 Tax=Boletus reticuloceps TaxID=495285 RepID=A0A8I2YWW5_9AGAM|nr:glutathione S-transferase [Boletus reticuloceps]
MSEQKPLLLYTAPTPNGHKVSIMLEELKAVYGNVVDYDVEKIDISTNRQKEPWFIALNPNGRIPVLVDRKHEPEPFNVFETAAILLYLVRKFDTKGIFSFPVGSDDESVMLQWIFFAVSHSHHFRNYAPEDIPYGKKRACFHCLDTTHTNTFLGYIDETARLYNVLNIRLQDREYLAGPGKGKLSVADINVLPWVRFHARAGIETLDAFPNTKVSITELRLAAILTPYTQAWVERLSQRPGVQAGVQVP